MARSSSPPATTAASTASNSHRFPQFLPDGRHFLFLARVSDGSQDSLNEVMVASLDGGAPRALLRAPTNVAFAAGRLLYVRGRALVARRFAPGRLLLEADERVLAEGVRLIPAASLGVFSASSSGVLAYDQGADAESTQLVWLDRSGREVGTLGDPGGYFEERLSPDGRRVALTSEDPTTGRQDVWIMDVASGARTRLTLGKADGSFPVWNPDGRHVVFRARERGYLDLYERDLDSDEERLLLRTDADKLPTSISPDGRFLAYLVSLGRRGIWMLPLQGGGAPFLFRSSDSPQENAQFSPDGRWIAFEQTESARKDVYVTSFPKPGPAWRVSADGGETPRWSSDGRSVLYLSRDNRLMASTVTPRGPELEIGAPRLVGELSVRVSGIATGHGAESNYDVRGDRFLVLAARSARTRPLSLLLDWTALTR
jgi:Tol biopolymer transport system component